MRGRRMQWGKRWAFRRRWVSGREVRWAVRRGRRQFKDSSPPFPLTPMCWGFDLDPAAVEDCEGEILFEKEMRRLVGKYHSGSEWD